MPQNIFEQTRALIDSFPTPRPMHLFDEALERHEAAVKLHKLTAKEPFVRAVDFLTVDNDTEFNKGFDPHISSYTFPEDMPTGQREILQNLLRYCQAIYNGMHNTHTPEAHYFPFVIRFRSTHEKNFSQDRGEIQSEANLEQEKDSRLVLAGNSSNEMPFDPENEIIPELELNEDLLIYCYDEGKHFKVLKSMLDAIEKSCKQGWVKYGNNYLRPRTSLMPNYAEPEYKLISKLAELNGNVNKASVQKDFWIKEEGFPTVMIVEGDAAQAILGDGLGMDLSKIPVAAPAAGRAR